MRNSTCPGQVPGFTNHGDCNLRCKPTHWKDIVLFFLGNYGAHAATVITRPGQSILSSAFSILLALCFPGAGVLTGVQAISSLACFAPTQLTKAARAGALCMVYKANTIEEELEKDPETSRTNLRGRRSKEAYARIAQQIRKHPHMRTRDGVILHAKTSPNEIVLEMAFEFLTRSQGGNVCRTDGCIICFKMKAAYQKVAWQKKMASDADDQDLSDEMFPSYVSSTHVNGLSRLPRGYRLLVLPPWVTFENDYADGPDLGFRNWMEHTFVAPFRSRDKTPGTIASSYNIFKILISLGQAIYGAKTLYETRGNQIEMYGYAAFGLTVTPYIWMSMVNLVASLMCPQYPTMFLVNSPSLDALRQRVATKGIHQRYQFDSTVGRIDKETEERVIYSYGTILRANNGLAMALEMFYNERNPDRYMLVARALAAYAIAAVPIAIVGALSSFHPGRSQTYQRVWIVLWLCLGPMVGTGIGSIAMAFIESRPVLWRFFGLRKAESYPRHSETEANQAARLDDRLMWWERDLSGISKSMAALLTLFTVMYMIPAIAGYVISGQMLKEYGTCTRMDS